MRDFELVDQNLRTALQFFGTATGTGEVHCAAGIETIYCGLNYGVFNMGLLTGPTASLRERLDECDRYFASRTPKWSFWLCEDWLDPPARRQSRDTIAEAGMRLISQPPGMLASDLRPPSPGLPVLDVHPVENSFTRNAFAEITGVCFDIPHSICHSVYTPETAWRGSYRGFVGISAGRPVTIAAVCGTEGALGLYSVATLPEFRRRGFSESLVRTVVARERRGREPIVLQSSEAGYRLYRHLGFRDVAKFCVYLT